jgi:hypothetical protein
MHLKNQKFIHEDIKSRFNSGNVCLSVKSYFVFQFAIQNYLFTHSMKQSLIEKLTSSQPVKNCPAFYGTQRFSAAYASDHHLSLAWTRSSHLHLGLPSGLFPSGFPTKTLYTTHPSPTRATYPAQINLLNLIPRKIFGEQYRSLSSSLCSFLYSPVT